MDKQIKRVKQLEGDIGRSAESRKEEELFFHDLRRDHDSMKRQMEEKEDETSKANRSVLEMSHQLSIHEER